VKSFCRSAIDLEGSATACSRTRRLGKSAGHESKRVADADKTLRRLGRAWAKAGVMASSHGKASATPTPSENGRGGKSFCVANGLLSWEPFTCA